MLWKLIGGGVFLAVIGFLIVQYGAARYDQGKLQERTHWEHAARLAEISRGEERLADERRVSAAVLAYSDALAAQQPVILRSIDTVREYAQTPAGAVLCLPADRVWGIDADAAALGLQPAPAAPGGGSAVPANPDPAPG